MKGEF